MSPLASSQDSESHKRKREADDNAVQQSSHADRIPQPPPPQSGNGTPINYLSRASNSRLGLIQGGPETFSDVISLIDEYEGVLSRHESLAANLGAKPTAPRLLRAMEGVFEGTISVSPRSPFGDSRASSWYSPSWLDIVAFAKTNPGDFNLTTTPDGRRVCQFYLKDVRVEISEDDWRFIVSGALDRFHLVPTHPLEEDETAELATLEILELRLQTLINKADEVARKARQLNYHLSGRKASIIARLSSQHQSHAGASRSVNPLRRSGGPNPGYDLHADLLQQFLVPSPQPISRARVLNPPPSPLDIIRHRATPSITQQPQLLLQSSRPSPPHGPDSPVHRDISYDHPSSVHRPLIQARIEKLSRGDAIAPPCDRCRRLKTQCIKHLTACQGCTKKHAKCSWRGVTDDEIHALRGEQQQQHLLLPPSASAPPGADEDAAEDTPGSSNPREAAAARMSGEPDLREEEEEGQGHGQAPAHNNSSAPAEHAPPLPLPRHGMAGAPLSYLLHAEPHRDKPSR